MPSIMRIKKQSGNFVIINNNVLQNKDLSMKAKGLLAYLLSHPENWQIHIKKIVLDHADGRDAVYSAIKELKTAGYIQHHQERDAKGQMLSGEYQVFEEPQYPHPENPDMGHQSSSKPHTEMPEAVATPGFPPHPGNPDTVNPDTANPPLIIKNINNNKINKQQTHSKPNPLPQVPFASAADIFAPEDCVIGDKLTAQQVSHIQAFVHKRQGPTQPTDDYVQAVMHTLLDCKSFTNAGIDFEKKLNTLGKAWDNNTWAPERVSALIQAQRTKIEIATKKSLEQQRLRDIQALEQEKAGFVAAMQGPMGKNPAYVSSCQAAIDVLVEKMHTLKQPSLTTRKQPC